MRMGVKEKGSAWWWRGGGEDRSGYGKMVKAGREGADDVVNGGEVPMQVQLQG